MEENTTLGLAQYMITEFEGFGSLQSLPGKDGLSSRLAICTN